MSFRKRTFKKNNDYSYYPWTYFYAFFFSSILLSYFPMPLSLKFTVFLIGIFLPLFIAFRMLSPGRSESPIYLKEIFFNKFPSLFIFFVLLAAVFLRFYRLETLSVWPVLDEGRNAFFGWRLTRHWDWRLFYDSSQMPPLSYWLFGLYFKIIQPSLLSLWLFPCLLSFFLLPAGYLAARRYFPQSFSLLFLCLLAMSFYPVYVGRFNHQAVLLVFWELLTFAVLGYYLSDKTSAPRLIALLGICTGVGFYIYFSWPLVAVMVVILVLCHAAGQKRKLILVFGFAGLIVVFPLLVAAFREGYGTYFQSLWIHPGQDLLLEWLNNSFSYLTGLFWGLETGRHAYKPFWGGYLNPMLTASFFIGILELLRFRKLPVPRVLLGMLALFLLPAFSSKEIEMFRIVQIMPALLVVAAAGLMVLLSRFSSKNRFVVLGIVLLFSVMVDFYHLAGPYHEACSSRFERWADYSKSVERWRAYQILKKISSAQGPGYLFSGFDPYPFDKSLVIAAGTFNLEGRPGMKVEKAKWAAFLTNINYRPFLSERFPQAQLTWLSADLSPADGGLMLVVMPVERYLEPLSQWSKADEVLEPASFEMLNRPFGDKRKKILEKLSAAYPAFQGDPFLESIFWNLVYLNHSADGQFQDAMLDLNQALTQGYSTAYFYNELGSLLFSKQDYKGARKAFEEAIRSELNLTPAEENLRYMNRMEKVRRP